jgi:hypothetical protein
VKRHGQQGIRAAPLLAARGGRCSERASPRASRGRTGALNAAGCMSRLPRGGTG